MTDIAVASMQIVSVGRCGTVKAGGIRIPLWGIKLYEAVSRKRDGLYVWVLKDVLYTASGKVLSKKTADTAIRIAEDRGIPFRNGVTNNMLCDMSPLEMLAAQAVEEG